jgi:ankyrin repeat protein
MPNYDFEELHRLIKGGDTVAVRNALQAGADANQKNRYSWSLLMLAALEGNTTIGELLVEYGAKIDALNDFGESALSLAAHGGFINFVKLLKQKGSSGICRPHGHSLEAWLRMASGLPPDKIDLIMLVLAPLTNSERSDLQVEKRCNPGGERRS